MAHGGVGGCEVLRFLRPGEDDPIPRSIEGMPAQRIGVGDLAGDGRFGLEVLVSLVERPDDDRVDDDKQNKTCEGDFAIELAQEPKDRGVEPSPDDGSAI